MKDLSRKSYSSLRRYLELTSRHELVSIEAVNCFCYTALERVNSLSRKVVSEKCTRLVSCHTCKLFLFEVNHEGQKFQVVSENKYVLEKKLSPLQGADDRSLNGLEKRIDHIT